MVDIEAKLLELFKIPKSDIIGIYMFGSRLYNEFNIVSKSDYDFCIIINNSSSFLLNPEYFSNPYFQYESENIDFHIMSEMVFYNELTKCNIMTLECFYSEDPIFKHDVNLELNLGVLRHSISKVSSNSFVKFKKKLTKESGLKNKHLGVKSLYHSLRILEFGCNVANDPDFIEHNYQNKLKDILEFSQNVNFDWKDIHTKYKPVYNQLASRFKLMAPKGK